MPMTPFAARFPELAPKETRSATIPPGHALPAGDYGFVELYCDEPGCDCRHVFVQVLRPHTGWTKVWATISYGWESPEFYREWSGDPADAPEWAGTRLEPLQPQSQYAEELLDLFRFILQSPDYEERLRRHYELFRQSVSESESQ